MGEPGRRHQHQPNARPSTTPQQREMPSCSKNAAADAARLALLACAAASLASRGLSPQTWGVLSAVTWLLYALEATWPRSRPAADGSLGRGGVGVCGGGV